MANSAEIEAAKAKEEFAKSLNEFGPLQFIQEKPFIAIGIALAVGAVIGLSRLPKIRALVFFPKGIKLISKAVGLKK